MKNKNEIKWVHRLFKINWIFFLIMYAILGFKGSHGYQKHSFIYFFLAVSSLAFGVTNFMLAKKFRKKEEKYWISAIVVSIFTLISPLFPLAILSLKELLNEKKRKKYLQKNDKRNLMLWEMVKNPIESTFRGDFKIYGLIIVMISMAFIFRIKTSSNIVNISKYQLHSNERFKLSDSVPRSELYAIGKYCNQKKEYKICEIVFKNLVHSDKNDLKARVNYAISLHRNGKYKSAIKNFHIYFKRGGKAYHDAIVHYANSLKKIGNNKQALALYREALVLRPELKDVAKNLSIILIQQKKYNEAYHFLNKYVKNNPGSIYYLDSYRKFLKRKI